MTNQPLAKSLRTQLESAVKSARTVGEIAARAALARLAVAEAKAPDYLADEGKALRRRLRAHGRALGDVKSKDDTQALIHLVWEVAYEHWHRMLFARFLAENGLLMWEPGAPVSLDDCRDMVDNHPEMALGSKSHWELAGKLAARMLPQVFKPQSPVFELAFAPEHQRELERLLAALPAEMFAASDSLGWVYQFWQAKRKDEVNASEVKIGADELPAVTQLFTEPYMVDFLLHNSLGAWWVTRHPSKASPVALTYLRMLEDGTPAAGRFEAWPDSLRNFRLLDPCCGSGHFLVAAFLMLVPMRMSAESLSAADAVDAVLTENLHGLELDARCVEIAVFALALSAWRFPAETGEPLGVRVQMPAPQVACCGLKVAATPEDWMALVPDNADNPQLLRQELGLLHASFAQAPLLGSLLDPARSLKEDLATSSFATLRELMERALAAERPATLWGEANELQEDTWDLALTARGLLDAARLLDERYHLVVTNPPYLVRGKQSDQLSRYISSHYAEGDADIATAFVLRFDELLLPGGVHGSVTPLNWFFLKSYSDLRRILLDKSSVRLLAKVGSGATAKASWDVLRALALVEKTPPSPGRLIVGVEAPSATEEGRAQQLRESQILKSTTQGVRRAPDSKFALGLSEEAELLEAHLWSFQGLATADFSRYGRKFWEIVAPHPDWVFQHSTFASSQPYAGLEHVLHWEKGEGALANSPTAAIRGGGALGKRGVVITQTRTLPASLYLGQFFDNNVAVLVPNDEKILPALWCYCSSVDYYSNVRKLDEKLGVTNATLAKVPFDLKRWEAVATERYPNGLPKAYSDNPTQWLFHGHPQPATDPLQVAVARLSGYRWPAEKGAVAELADQGLTWIVHCQSLASYADEDGIVCLPSVRGEPAAHERLLKLLIASWETVQSGSWKPSILDKLLADADCAGKGLDVWLRDKFFEQHAKLFQHRPFIWHVWDGLKDGFAALVNYHQLDAKKLDRLIHTYIGDWISHQETGARNGVDGASQRLAAAQDLQRRLKLIQDGEPPYDVFVRWKPLAQQPFGWNPDLNDGARLNSRPFVTAEVLRHIRKPKLNISWEKDRGKDVESSPWFKVFKGERINDHHLTLDEKRKARAKAERS